MANKNAKKTAALNLSWLFNIGFERTRAGVENGHPTGKQAVAFFSILENAGYKHSLADDIEAAKKTVAPQVEALRAFREKQGWRPGMLDNQTENMAKAFVLDAAVPYAVTKAVCDAKSNAKLQRTRTKKVREALEALDDDAKNAFNEVFEIPVEEKPARKTRKAASAAQPSANTAQVVQACIDAGMGAEDIAKILSAL